VLRICYTLALVSVLGGTLAAQQPQSSGTLTDTELVGRKIFQTRCAMCHVGQDPATEFQSDAEKPAQPRQTTFGPLLSKAQTANETLLRSKIANGGPRMPAYKLALTDEQIGQVIAFMKTIEKPLTLLASDKPGE